MKCLLFISHVPPQVAVTGAIAAIKSNVLKPEDDGQPLLCFMLAVEGLIAVETVTRQRPETRKYTHLQLGILQYSEQHNHSDPPRW